jgi:predicted RNA methylase
VYRWIRRNAVELLFDRRYGIRTSGQIDLSEFGLAHEERVYYIASNWRILRQALRHYEIGSNDVFIDIGSGMGRMVLEAARYPFKRVIGVELVGELHGIAEENVRRMRRRGRCGEIELVNSDIVDYDVPDDVTFVYMFNPFRGAIFEAAIGSVIQSLDRNLRTVHVIYTNPFEEAYLLGTGRFELEAVEKHVHLYRSAHSGRVEDRYSGPPISAII